MPCLKAAAAFVLASHRLPAVSDMSQEHRAYTEGLPSRVWWVCPVQKLAIA